MDAPKCRACGKREWNHVCGSGAPPLVVPEYLAEAAREQYKGPFIVSGPILAAPRAPRGTFDRVAYQREYMRKRRAAEKRQKP